MLFIAFMSNGLNLLDGMDGLAAGSTAIMASFMAALAFYEGNQELGLILMALVGACLGFLVYNLPRAKTFMGDIGSLFLGYMLAVASLQLWYRQPISITRVLGVLLILAVPITDTCLAIIRRFQAHRAIFSGDRFHLYDCIYRKLGRNTWATLATMWGIALASGAVGSFVFFTETTTAVSLTTFFAIGMIVLAGRVGSLHISATLDRHRMPM
jgi:UDP-GlcNAc:undecaprenyl-phosphate GlcNAc-1-phosphate transferase